MFPEHTLRHVSRKISEEVIETLTQDLLGQLSVEKPSELEGMRKRLCAFRASSGWVRNDLKRNNFCSRVGAGTAGHFSEETVRAHRFMMQKRLACISINDLCNTDEVAMLYRSFPKRAIHFADGPATYERKACLTAVLTVFADGTKALLTVIGRYKKPKRFPRHFDATRDLGIVHKSQKEFLEDTRFVAADIKGFNTMATLQGRKITAVLDNYSAHTVDYMQYSSYEEVLLPPNLTAHLQPVDSSIGNNF